MTHVVTIYISLLHYYVLRKKDNFIKFEAMNFAILTFLKKKVKLA